MSDLASLARYLPGEISRLSGLGSSDGYGRVQGRMSSSQGSFPVPRTQVLCTTLAPEVADEVLYSSQPVKSAWLPGPHLGKLGSDETRRIGTDSSLI